MIPLRVLLRRNCKGFCSQRICKAVALLVLAITAALPASAQVQAGSSGSQAAASAAATPKVSTTGKLTFEAASVRPSTQRTIIGWEFLSHTSNAAPPPGGLFSWNVPLTFLILFAYDIRSQQESSSMMNSLPKWAQMPENSYAIEARAEGNPIRDDVRQMVRSLLEDRFQFAAHIEKRDGQIYALVVDKPASGLKSHPEGAPCTLSPSQTDENKYPHAYPSYKPFNYPQLPPR
jgi:hypothetical protein